MTSRNHLARRTPFGGMPVGTGFVGAGDTLATDCSTLKHRRGGTVSWRSTTPTSAFAPKPRGSRRISRIRPTAVDRPLVFNPLACASPSQGRARSWRACCSWGSSRPRPWSANRRTRSSQTSSCRSPTTSRRSTSSRSTTRCAPSRAWTKATSSSRA